MREDDRFPWDARTDGLLPHFFLDLDRTQTFHAKGREDGDDLFIHVSAAEQARCAMCTHRQIQRCLLGLLELFEHTALGGLVCSPRQNDQTTLLLRDHVPSRQNRHLLNGFIPPSDADGNSLLIFPQDFSQGLPKGQVGSRDMQHRKRAEGTISLGLHAGTGLHHRHVAIPHRQHARLGHSLANPVDQGDIYRVIGLFSQQV